jgi:hypothetical protein
MRFTFTLKFSDFLKEKKPLLVYLSLFLSSTLSANSRANSVA